MRASTFRVTDRVYCVMRKSYFTCAYLIEATDGGIVAIDAGMKSSGVDMLGALAEIGRGPHDVRALLVTHWHNDHSAGAAELAAVSGAPVYYHAAESENLTRRAASSGVRLFLSHLVPETGPLVLVRGLLENAPARAVAATHHVRDGDAVLCEFRVVESPGHTRGHCSYLHLPTGTLFAGDALAVIDGRLRFMARPVTPDLAQARASMMRLLDLPTNAICPGHREPLERVMNFRSIRPSVAPA